MIVRGGFVIGDVQFEEGMGGCLNSVNGYPDTAQDEQMAL